MKCAIIMRSKNERPHLDRALEALFKQNWKHFVLYNIDSGSMDGSVDLIRRYNPDPARFVQIEPHDYVPGKVLNLMVGKAQEPLIVFLNGDAVPQGEDWLETLIRPILSNQADATMSRQIPRENATFIASYDLQRGYLPANIAKNPYFFSAVSCAFKRQLWEETPFYTEGYSEDLLWCKECSQKGARFLYVPESVVEHSHNYAFSDWYLRNYHEGVVEKILGNSPHIIGEAFSCLREIGRDLIYTIAKGRFFTIPYNIAYRIVGHKGKYDGKKEG